VLADNVPTLKEFMQSQRAADSAGDAGGGAGARKEHAEELVAYTVDSEQLSGLLGVRGL